MPKDSLFRPDEPHGFQVWHKQGRHYAHVATVESNALGAIMMTNHGFMGYARWQDNPAVTAMPGEHRSTTIGDVLIGRDGQSLEIVADDGLLLKPIASVDGQQEPADLAREVDVPRAPEPARREETAQAPVIRILPGRDNPVYRGESTFDIHDATGKIGHLAGYMGGPWAESEFRLTHVEISEPGRSLTPGQWKGVLRGLAEQLPDAEYLGANRTGVNGDLSPAYEKLIWMPPTDSGVARDLPAPAATEGGFGRPGGMETPGSEAGHADTGAEGRRLPSPSQIIADPAAYLTEQRTGKDTDLER